LSLYHGIGLPVKASEAISVSFLIQPWPWQLLSRDSLLMTRLPALNPREAGLATLARARSHFPASSLNNAQQRQ
jgi:hypothetical protein